MNPRQKFSLFFGVKLERGGDFDICQITFAFEDDITILSWIKRKEVSISYNYFPTVPFKIVISENVNN